MFKIIEQNQLSAAVAEEFFGWRWMSFVGIPTRDHPGYPAKCRVRQFMSPKSLANKRWIAFFDGADGRGATGDEPLAYTYCSAAGPDCFPSFSSDVVATLELEKELNKRGLLKEYHDILVKQVGAKRPGGSIDIARMMHASCEQRCIAALAAADSKYVTNHPSTR